MDPAAQARIAALGGTVAHENGTAHEFSQEEAKEAGRKGGLAVSRDRAYMAEIGRRGGLIRAANAKADRERKARGEKEPPEP